MTHLPFVAQEIQFWFTKLILLLEDVVKQVGNLLFRLVFDTAGLGSVIKGILRELCIFANLVLTIWNNTACVIARDVIAPIVSFLITILSTIIGLFVQDAGGIIPLLNQINSAITNMKCDTELKCGDLNTSRPDYGNGALPVADRCWVDFLPGVDTADAFSCTRSDTW